MEQTFDFAVPDTLRETAALGCRVSVRFHDRTTQGIVVALSAHSDHEGPFESVDAVLPKPCFSAYGLEFAQRIARDRLTPPGILLNRALPARTGKTARRWVRLAIPVDEARAVVQRLQARAPRQAEAVRWLLGTDGPLPESALRNALGTGVRAVVTRLSELGVVHTADHPGALPETELRTTELDLFAPSSSEGTAAELLLSRDRLAVYRDAIAAALYDEGFALVIAPSILHARGLHRELEELAPGRAALYHSGLSEGKRGDAWEATRDGSLRLLVGTRSALFVPAQSPGLIVLDDEGSSGHRQEAMSPHFHTLDLARAHAPDRLLLGASAPSVESWHDAVMGAVTLRQAAEESDTVDVRVVDVRRDRDPISEVVKDGIASVVQTGDRVLVAVPRRGYFQAIVCKACGRPLRCPHCSASLTYRPQSAQFVCRACGRAAAEAQCSACGSRALRFVGHGSEQIAEFLANAFPEVSVARIDGAALRRAEEIEAAEDAMAGAAQLLVATPVIASGPPLSGLRAVAALDLDALLARSDFRAAESAFQMLDGLRGRMTAGTLFVQTNCPEHPVIAAIAEGDAGRFYRTELEERRALGYPPFTTLVRVRLAARGGGRTALQTTAERMRNEGVEVLGPVEGRDGLTLLAKLPDPRQAAGVATALRAAHPGAELDLDGRPA